MTASTILPATVRFRPGQTIRPQDAVNLTLFWHATASLPDDYTVFVHIRDAEGKVVFQDDFTPSPNTRGWWPGDSIWQTRTLSVPADTGTGEYRIYSGMYLLSTMERLPVKGGNASSDNAIYLTSLWVKR